MDESKERMAVPLSPADIDIAADAPTANEIESYMSQWLLNAVEDKKVRDLALIVHALGEDYPVIKTSYPNIYQYVMVLRLGDHSAYYHRLKSYSGGDTEIEMFILKVVKDENTDSEVLQVLLSYSIVRDENGDIIEDMLADAVSPVRYIPGDWEKQYFALEKKAFAKINRIKKARAERERNRMLKEIGLTPLTN